MSRNKRAFELTNDTAIRESNKVRRVDSDYRPSSYTTAVGGRIRGGMSRRCERRIAISSSQSVHPTNNEPKEDARKNQLLLNLQYNCDDEIVTANMLESNGKGGVAQLSTPLNIMDDVSSPNKYQKKVNDYYYVRTINFVYFSGVGNSGPKYQRFQYHPTSGHQAMRVFKVFDDKLSTTLNENDNSLLQLWRVFKNCMWDADLPKTNQKPCTPEELEEFESIFMFNPRDNDSGELEDVGYTILPLRAHSIQHLISLGYLNTDKV